MTKSCLPKDLNHVTRIIVMRETEKLTFAEMQERFAAEGKIISCEGLRAAYHKWNKRLPLELTQEKLMGVKEDAAKIGFYTITSTSTGGDRRSRWACKCSKCSKEQSWGWSQIIPVDQMLKNARNSGWTVEHKNLVCEDCSKKKSETQAEVIPMTTTSKVSKRLIFEHLSSYFDADKGVYSPGWSDKRIATEAHTSESFVADIRREEYGEISEDPAIIDLRQKLETLKAEAEAVLKKLSDMESEMGNIQKRLDGLAMRKVS